MRLKHAHSKRWREERVGQMMGAAFGVRQFIAALYGGRAVIRHSIPETGLVAGIVLRKRGRRKEESEKKGPKFELCAQLVPPTVRRLVRRLPAGDTADCQSALR
jgi:hypothetical protein